MRPRIKKLIFRFALLSMFALAGALFLTSARGVRAEKPEGPGKAESQSRKLEGTWRVQVTIRDCQSGAAVRTFPALLTFARGGTLTETTTGFPPALRTPGHGFWRHTGGQTYIAVSEAFLFNPPAAGPARRGSRSLSSSGMTRTSSTVQLRMKSSAPTAACS
jgi:hypothetical protein